MRYLKRFNETFFDFDSDNKESLNDEPEVRDKIDFGKSQLVINDGDIDKGLNKVYLDGTEVATFIISSIGDYKDTHNDVLYKNSIFFRGGFIVKNDYMNKGIGHEVIKKIFRDTSFDNIFLYAIDWQGAVDFWKKIGGEVIYRNEENGLNLIKIHK